MKYHLKKDGQILFTRDSQFIKIPKNWGLIEAGWRTNEQCTSLGILITGLEERLVIDREEIPAKQELKDENDLVIQEASDLIPAVTHLEYFVPANYTIELEDEESSEYKLSHYAELRAKEYPSLPEQMDMQFHDLINGTTVWKDLIASVKAKYPKA